LVLVPELVSIYPNTGSLAGSRLEVNAPGACVGNTYDVVNQAAESICESVTVENYGLVVCMTKPEAIENTDIRLRDVTGHKYYAWESRAVPVDTTVTCPGVNDIYTNDYWLEYYAAVPYEIDETTYYAHQMDDLSFNFSSYYMTLHPTLTDDDVKRFLDTNMESADYGTFFWGSYHLFHNAHLTEQDLIDHMDVDGSFDTDMYEAAQV
jgi:hypothetical protein